MEFQNLGAPMRWVSLPTDCEFPENLHSLLKYFNEIVVSRKRKVSCTWLIPSREVKRSITLRY